MNKVCQLFNLFILIVIPIIGNLLFLIIFPLFVLQSIFTDNDDFHEGINKYYDSIAKFDK